MALNFAHGIIERQPLVSMPLRGIVRTDVVEFLMFTDNLFPFRHGQLNRLA